MASYVKVKSLALTTAAVAGGAVSACKPTFSNHPSAAEVAAATNRWLIGSDGVARALDEDEVVHDYVLIQICSGSSDWLDVARSIYPTRSAHLNEEFSSAIAVALVKAPTQALRRFGEDVCHVPDYLPASCNTTDWSQRARTAVESIPDGDLESAKRQCLAQIPTDGVRD